MTGDEAQALALTVLTWLFIALICINIINKAYKVFTGRSLFPSIGHGSVASSVEQAAATLEMFTELAADVATFADVATLNAAVAEFTEERDGAVEDPSPAAILPLADGDAGESEEHLG